MDEEFANSFVSSAILRCDPVAFTQATDASEELDHWQFSTNFSCALDQQFLDTFPLVSLPVENLNNDLPAHPPDLIFMEQDRQLFNFLATLLDSLPAVPPPDAIDSYPASYVKYHPFKRTLPATDQFSSPHPDTTPPNATYMPTMGKRPQAINFYPAAAPHSQSISCLGWRERAMLPSLHTQGITHFQLRENTLLPPPQLWGITSLG